MVNRVSSIHSIALETINNSSSDLPRLLYVFPDRFNQLISKIPWKSVSRRSGQPRIDVSVNDKLAWLSHDELLAIDGCEP